MLARSPVLAALLALTVAGSVPALADQDDVAARGPGVTIGFEELDELLLDRHAMSPDGRALLELLLKKHLLGELAAEAGLTVSDDDVSRRWSRIDRAARAAGNAEGLLAEIERRGFTVDEFREFLRLSIVQERLAKRALGVAEDDEIDSESQDIWLQQEIVERGLEHGTPPWRLRAPEEAKPDDDFVLRCGDIEIGPREFGEFLRLRLPSENVREAAGHLLLLRGIEKRMPDLSIESRHRGIEEELARRRAAHEASVPGLSFEQRLATAGRSVDQMRRDPAVHIAAMTRLWVERTEGKSGIREAFERERSYFEGRYGRAVQAHVLFLRGGRFVNDLVPRTYAAAEAKLVEIADRVGDVQDFRALAGELSEDPTTRQAGGELGWITRLDERVPEALRSALFEFLDAGGTIPSGGCSLPPVQMDTGMALLWVSGVRESPSWEVMSEHVSEELRTRFMERVLPENAIELWR